MTVIFRKIDLKYNCYGVDQTAISAIFVTNSISTLKKLFISLHRDPNKKFYLIIFSIRALAGC